MPYYQLPTGKTIFLSVDQVLEMTDEDLQYYISTGQGAAPRDPFFGSATRKSQKADANPYEKDGIDYQPEEEETSTTDTIDLNNIPDEDSFSD